MLFWTILGGLLLGLLAVIFGILGFRRGKRGQATNGTLAVVGAVIGGLALVGRPASSSSIADLRAELRRTTSSSTTASRRPATQAEEQKCQEDFVKSITG